MARCHDKEISKGFCGPAIDTLLVARLATREPARAGSKDGTRPTTTKGHGIPQMTQEESQEPGRTKEEPWEVALHRRALAQTLEGQASVPVTHHPHLCPLSSPGSSSCLVDLAVHPSAPPVTGCW